MINEELDKEQATVVKTCLLCPTVIESKLKKYCGLDNYVSNCKTCGEDYSQKCQGRTNSYCSKVCQANDSEVIKSANAKRQELGYLSENALNTSKKIKEKYGVDNISQLDWVKEKKKESGPTGFAREGFKENFKKKHGVDNASQLSWVKEKKRENALEKYGVDNVSKSLEIIEKIRITTIAKYGVETVLMLPENQLKSALAGSSRVSKVNRKWQQDILNETGVLFDFEQPVNNEFLTDLGYKNIRIDINPSISHSSNISYPHAIGICRDKDCSNKKHRARERLYHQKRALIAEKDNLLMLQYFDWYDKNIFMNILKAKLHMTEKRVYARKTELREIKQSEANKFFKENHLLGGSNGQTFCLGLFYNNELVHCQTYGKARMSKKAEWEAIRSCSKLNTQIIGGFSKCDKYFFKKVNPESVISYVDLSTSHGDTESMFDGWELSHVSTPSAMWTKFVMTENNANSNMFIKDSSVRRQSADRMLGFEVGEKYPELDENGEKLTNDYVMLSEGYNKVYDCGTKVFLYKRDNEKRILC